MLDPDEADLVDATVDWARKHGQENRPLLSLTHAEWLRIWFAAWMRSLARAVRVLFTGAEA
jgi:hypothetical protein